MYFSTYIYLSIYLPIYLSDCLSLSLIHLSLYLSLYLFIHLYFSHLLTFLSFTLSLVRAVTVFLSPSPRPQNPPAVNFSQEFTPKNIRCSLADCCPLSNPAASSSTYPRTIVRRPTADGNRVRNRHSKYSLETREQESANHGDEMIAR